MNYIKSGNFIVDIISAVPISEFIGGDNGGTLRLINLVKILRLLRLQRLLKLLQSEKVKLLGYLLKSCITFVIILHWLNCLWFIVASDQETYINKNVKWIPSSVMQVIQSSNQDYTTVINDFYDESKHGKTYQYCFSLYSVIIVILGGDI